MSGAHGACWEHNYMSHTFLTGDILKMKLDNMAIAACVPVMATSVFSPQICSRRAHNEIHTSL